MLGLLWRGRSPSLVSISGLLLEMSNTWTSMGLQSYLKMTKSDSSSYADLAAVIAAFGINGGNASDTHVDDEFWDDNIGSKQGSRRRSTHSEAVRVVSLYFTSDVKF